MSDHPRGPHRDPQTGTLAEPSLLRLLDSVLALAEPVGPQVGLLSLGIDRLDALAAQHGPGLREAALLGLADRLHERVRGHDLIGRSGDGFAICLAEVFPAQAAGLAARLLRAVQDQPMLTPVGALPLTCSIGLVMSRGGSETAAALLQRARAAQETARRAGGDRLVTAI